jgi:hypothetical protein
MTRKDFEMIANVIRARVELHTSHNPTYRTAQYEIANDMATALASTNSRFNRARFLAACGFEGERYGDGSPVEAR